MLSEHFGDKDAVQIDGWIERGGYVALKKALDTPQDEIIEIVKEAKHAVNEMVAGRLAELAAYRVSGEPKRVALRSLFATSGPVES